MAKDLQVAQLIIWDIMRSSKLSRSHNRSTRSRDGKHRKRNSSFRQQSEETVHNSNPQMWNSRICMNMVALNLAATLCFYKSVADWALWVIDFWSWLTVTEANCCNTGQPHERRRLIVRTQKALDLHFLATISYRTWECTKQRNFTTNDSKIDNRSFMSTSDNTD